jgi:hypothetical protein
MLGSHIRIADILAERGTPLATLPFRGAVYRVAHGGSHSKTPSLLVKYFLSRKALKRPRRMLGNLRKLRLVDARAKHEFFGGPAPIDGRGSGIASRRRLLRFGGAPQVERKAGQ